MERVADLAPREPAERHTGRRSLRRSTQTAAVRNGLATPRPRSQPSERAGGGPVRREHDHERHDRDRAEVPDHDMSERVVDDRRRRTRSPRRARGRASAPRDEERNERDARERPEVERRPRRGEQRAGDGGRAEARRRRSVHAQSRQIMRFSSASWWRGSTRKQLRHRNSFSRRGTILVPPSPGSSGSSSSSSPSRPGGDRALAQHDVERLLDVVGVELLVEVDDVVLVVVLGFFDRGVDDRHDRADHRERARRRR